MGAYYDEIEIEDMTWDDDKAVYHYPCPCGDRFEISRRQLANYEDVATCPSCSLIIRVIFDPVSVSSSKAFLYIQAVPIQLDFEDEAEEDEDDSGESDEDNSDSGDDHFEDAMEKLTI